MSSLSFSGNTDCKRNSEKERDSAQQQQQQRPESRYADLKFVMGYLKKQSKAQVLRKCIQVWSVNARSQPGAMLNPELAKGEGVGLPSSSHFAFPAFQQRAPACQSDQHERFFILFYFIFHRDSQG